VVVQRPGEGRRRPGRRGRIQRLLGQGVNDRDDAPIRLRGPAVLPELHMHQTKVRAGLKRAVEKVEARF
jgi:hypothetical protein